jgi:hypothetical protein
MIRFSPKAQAITLTTCATLAILIVVGGLLIVPRHAIVVLTTAAILIGMGAVLVTPGLVSRERYLRAARGEGAGADDGTAQRSVCSECSWHWRAGGEGEVCPRCGAPAA